MTARPLLKERTTTKVSAYDRWRAKTNYSRRNVTGYARITFAELAEIPRLTTGKETAILLLLLGFTVGQRVEEGEPRLDSTQEPFRTSELCELACCDERTVVRGLGALEKRKIIEWEKPKKGWNHVRVLYGSWASLPTVVLGPVLVDDPEIDDEPLTEDPTKNATTTHVTAKPVYVAAGKKSKPLKIECGVAALQFSGDIDAAWSAVVSGGTLLVSLQQKWGEKNGVNGLQNTKGLDAKIPQGCLISPEQSRGKRTKGERRTTSEEFTSSSVQHPRAEELSNLFDPFLLKSCGKSLSGDHVALLAACEAVQDVPHDFLVKVVVDRAARPISGPKAAVAICQEVYHNWQRSKDLPVQKKIPTHEELQAMVREDREKRLAAQKKGRVA